MTAYFDKLFTNDSNKIELGIFNQPQDVDIVKLVNARLEPRHPDRIPVIKREETKPAKAEVETRDDSPARPPEDTSHESTVPFNQIRTQPYQVEGQVSSRSRVTQMKPRVQEPPANSDGTCDRGHELKINGGYEYGQIDSDCSSCRVPKIMKSDFYHHCQYCQIFYCHTCYLIRMEDLKPEYKLPMGKFVQIKHHHQAYMRCASRFVRGCDPSLAQCQQGEDEEGFGAEHWRRGGFVDEETDIFFCTPCMSKWTQANLNPKTTVSMNEKLFEEILDEQPIPAIPSIEEDNKVIGNPILKPEEARQEIQKRFLQKVVAPTCLEEVISIQDLIRESEFDIGETLLPGYEEVRQDDFLVNSSLSFVQGTDQYWGILGTTSLAEAEDDTMFMTRCFFIFGKENLKINKMILVEQTRGPTLEWRKQSSEPSYWTIGEAIFYWKRILQNNRSALALTKLDLKTLVETLVDRFIMEDPQIKIRTIQFGQYLGETFYTYYKQGNQIKLRVDSSKAASIQFAKDLKKDPRQGSVLVIDGHRREILDWISWDIYQELVNRAKGDYVLTDAEVIGKQPGERVSEAEISTLRRLRIFLQKDEGNERASISVFSLSNLRGSPLVNSWFDGGLQAIEGCYVKEEFSSEQRREWIETFIYITRTKVCSINYYPHDEQRREYNFRTADWHQERYDYYPDGLHNQHPLLSLGNLHNVQELTVFVRRPNQRRPITFTQFYLLGPNPILLYPRLNPEKTSPDYETALQVLDQIRNKTESKISYCVLDSSTNEKRNKFMPPKFIRDILKTSGVIETIENERGLLWEVDDLFQQELYSVYKPDSGEKSPSYLFKLSLPPHHEIFSRSLQPTDENDYLKDAVCPIRKAVARQRSGVDSSKKGNITLHQKSLISVGVETSFTTRNLQGLLRSSVFSNLFFSQSKVIATLKQLAPDVYQYNHTLGAVIESLSKPGRLFQIGRTRQPIYYARSDEKYIFVYRIEEGNEFDIFHVLSNEEVEAFQKDNGKHLLTSSSEIFTILPSSSAEEKFHLHHFTLDQYHDNKLACHFGKKFSFETLRDLKFTSNFLPLLFSDDDNQALLFLDFNKGKLLYTSIKDQAPQAKQSSSAGFQLCRSSESIKCSENVTITKYSLASEQPRRIKIREFSLVENSKTRTAELQQTGLRQILSKVHKSLGFQNFTMYPYSGESGSIEGIQVFPNTSLWSFVVFDEKYNRQQFQYQSSTMKFGYQKMKISLEEVYRNYVFLLLSSTLNLESIESGNFDTREKEVLLENIVSGMLLMEPLQISDLIFSRPTSHVFQTYECLGGKSESDFLFLKDPESLAKAFQNQSPSRRDTLLWSLCPEGESDSFQVYVDELAETDLPSLANVRMGSDFNLVSPLERAYQVKAFKSTNIFLENILLSSNAETDKVLLSRVLPLAIRHSSVPSFASFLQSPREEGKICSIETKLQTQELPLYSGVSSTLRFKDYYDARNQRGELIAEIKKNLALAAEEKKSWNASFKNKAGQLFQSEASTGSQSYSLHYAYFDFQELILGEKLRSKEPVKFDSSYLSKLINKGTSDELFEQPSIQRVIDGQFMTTKTIAQVAFWFYVLLFVVPFVLSIFIEDIEVPCYIIGLIPQTFFYVVEIIELRELGRDYFRKGLWNFFDQIQFYNFLVLFLLSLGITFGLEEDGLKFVVALGKLLLLFEAFIKILYFIRIFESFGFLVQMVLLTMKDVIPFTVFLFMWVTFFAVSYKVLLLHIESDPEAGGEVDYVYLNEPVRFIIQSYRNSIGDISAPDYGEWAPSETGNQGLRYTMIYLVWFVWFINQFVNLIILLNFLIAVISQTYEKVISQQQAYYYRHKSMINEEVYQLGRLFGMTEAFKVLVLTVSSSHDEPEKDDWEGLIKTLKKDIHSLVRKQTKELSKQNKKLSAQMASFKKEILTAIKENNNNNWD